MVSMIEERYGRSADMRLHDLARRELGLPPRPPVSTSYIDAAEVADGAEEAEEDEDAFISSGTVLIGALDAQPRISLIPGALVTVVLSVVNDGTVTARNVRAILALPADTTYRAGTFAIDGKPGSDESANELFENGTDVGDIEPRARRTVLLKLVIDAGLGDIALSAHLNVAAGAVLGLRAMMLKRAAPSGRSVLAERPFYESDPDELASEALAEPANPPTIKVLQAADFPPLVIAVPAKEPAFVMEPTRFHPGTIVPGSLNKTADLDAISVEELPITVAETNAEPKPKIAAHPRIESVRSTDDQVSITGLGGPILTVRLDRKRLATLHRLFGGPTLGTIAHYLVLNALAATDALPGDGADGSIATFVAQQERLLSRALIATRLGKNPAPDSVSAPLPPFPPRVAAHSNHRPIDKCAPGEIRLVRALSTSDMIALQSIIANEGAAPFHRAAQLFVGLCSNDVVTAVERERREVQALLKEYAAQATDEIGRIFQGPKLSREPVPFRPTDPSFDAAARGVLTALEQGLA
jgi:uncharacterized repeat protein (TIGR01451 family)